MRKIFITIIATYILVTGFALAQNISNNRVEKMFQLYGYTATEADISYWNKTTKNIFGTLEENLQRRMQRDPRFNLEIIKEGTPLGVFGATTPFRPSEYKTNLAQSFSEGHAGTTLRVTSITTKDGNTLDGSILGDTIVLSINSSGDNSEIVKCTGLTTATKTFTGCTFGWRFDTNAVSSSNIEAHAPGEPVIISNSDTFLVAQYPTIDGDNTFTGDNTFSTTTQNIARIYFGDNEGAYIWYNTTTDQFGYATSTQTERQFNENGITFSTVNPIRLSSGELRLATTSSAYWWRLDGVDLSLSTSTNSGLEQYFNIRLNATTTWATNLTIGGNATTTGSHNVGELGFDGGDVMSKWPFFNAYASSSDFLIAANRYAWQSVTVPALGVSDAIKVRANFFVNGNAANCPGISIRFDSATSTLFPNDTSAATGIRIYHAETTLQNFNSASKNMLNHATTSSGSGSADVQTLRMEMATSTINTSDGVVVDIASEAAAGTCYIFGNTFSVDVIRNGYHP